MVSGAQLRATISEVLCALVRRGYLEADLHLAVRVFLFEHLRRRGRKKPRSLVALVRYGSWQLLLFLPNLLRLRRMKPTRCVVVPASHRAFGRSGDSAVSKHADSVVRDWASSHGRVLMLETGLGPAFYRSPDGVPIINISLVVLLLQRLMTVFSRGSREPAQLVTDALGELHALPVGLTRRQFSRRVERHLDRARGVRRLYSWFIRFAPDCELVSVVYYTVDAMALTASAHLRGCTTSEYQHGIQNDEHPMYALQDMPVDLSTATTLPREFRVWDDVAKRRATRWMSLYPSAGFCARVTGNLWLERLKTHQPVADQPSEGSRILIALQEWPITFNVALIPALGCLDPETEVIVRLHPRDTDSAELIRRTFEDAPYQGSLVVQLPGAEPIEAVLGRSSLCITGFSTVGVESLQLGKRCLFIHPNAREGLADYIDGQQCQYAESETDIRAALKAWQQTRSDRQHGRLRA